MYMQTGGGRDISTKHLCISEVLFFLQVLQARIHNFVGNVGTSWEAIVSNQTREL
jgi:hypothetical protein